MKYGMWKRYMALAKAPATYMAGLDMLQKQSKRAEFL